MQNTIQNDTSFFAPVCQVCQSQNESLRAVTYPVIFSVVFATFQRAFSGVFCAKHQRRYHILASLITSIAGWLGIPYGFFLTPLTLFKLARGGIVHVEESLQILKLIADKKLRTGDVHGAIRCMEECLKFQDDSEIREKLTRLYAQCHNTTNTNIFESIWQFLSIPILLATSLITGLFIGLLDIFLMYLLAPLYGESGSIFVAILSWLPTVTMLFLEILFIRFMLRWALHKGQITSILLGTLLTLSATFFAFYSILQGQSVLRNLEGLFTFFSISTNDGFFALRSVLTHGGIDVLINNFKQGDLPNIIFGILFASAIFLTLYTVMEITVQTVRWQSRLSQIRDSLATESSHSSTVAWGILGFFILSIGLIAALVYPGHFINIEQAHQEISLGTTELDNHRYDEAIDHFSKAVELWPTSATSHTTLSLGYFSKDKYDQAMKELDTSLGLDQESMFTHLMKAYGFAGQGKYTESLNEFNFVSRLQPEWGLPHAASAAIYYLIDENELADQEIQIALAYEANDGQTSSEIGAYYALMLDFKKAEEHMLKAINTSNNAEDYLALASIYMSQKKFDQATRVIEEARKRGANPVNVHLANINVAEAQEDIETANAILMEVIEVYPNQSDLLSESSYLFFLKGDFENSAAEAEKAVEINPYNSSGYIDKAFAYHAQGKLNEALTAAKQGVALYPKRDRAHYILGLCYMDLGMKKEAIKEFETFLNLYWERPLVKEYKENAVKYLEQLR